MIEQAIRDIIGRDTNCRVCGVGHAIMHKPWCPAGLYGSYLNAGSPNPIKLAFCLISGHGHTDLDETSPRYDHRAAVRAHCSRCRLAQGPYIPMMRMRVRRKDTP